MSKVVGKMEPPRQAAVESTTRLPRMRDVAVRAGVHQTTVSLALRNHASIPLATRERIKAVAEELGYRPNPLLDAFNFHRLSTHPVKTAPTLALVIDESSNQVFRHNAYHPLIYQGICAETKAQGLQIELFVTDGSATSANRLRRVLLARGISGVIVVTFRQEVNRLDLDWDRFCAVKIESRHLWPHLDVITNDQCQATRLAFRRLRSLGYRRIGLAACRDDEGRLGDPFCTGLLVEQAQIPESDRVPPLRFDLSDKGPQLRKKLANWVRDGRIGAVISNWNCIPADMRKTGLRVPQEVAFATLDKPDESVEVAGVVQNHLLVGRLAVEQLRSLLQVSARGIPEAQSVTLVPGYWWDGPSAPPQGRGR